MERNGEEHATNIVSFYRVMLPTVQYKKLSLPESFTSIYGDEISSTCHLIVPTGDTHQVRLVKKKNELWFKDGWEEFVRCYSIGFAYFMTFTYEKNSKFRVNLFDMTACEISYQSDVVGTGSLPSASRKNSFLEVLDIDSDDDEIKSDEEPSDNTSDTSLVSECSNCAAMRCEDNQKRSEASPYTEKETERFPTKYPYWLKNYKTDIEAVEAAGISIPTANPFFVMSIKRSHVDHGFLTIPRAFGHDHISCNTGDVVILQMTHGRKWEVTIRITHSEWTFGKGWRQFSRETGLEVNDVCLFELINAKKLIFKVRVATPSKI